MAPTTTAKPMDKPGTAAQWKKLGIHTITLPSGFVCKIRIPDLTLLLAAQAVPEDLRAVAYEEITTALRTQASIAARRDPELPTELAPERLENLEELNRFLVSQALVEPKMTMDELRVDKNGEGAVPSEDLLMLTEFASRERTVDARGVELGVAPLDAFDVFREAHECSDGCAHCLEVIGAYSTVPS